jgi:hypothetical protein
VKKRITYGDSLKRERSEKESKSEEGWTREVERDLRM